MQNLASVDFTYHVHPSGELDTTPKAPLGTTVIGGSTSSRNFGQEPSPGDITFAQQLSGSTHIVVGARDKNVYIYNGSGVRVKISLDNFNKLR
jgi:hypothetical protein